MKILPLVALVLTLPLAAAHAQETEPPDGTRIATGGSDYRIVLTDVHTRRIALRVEDTEMIYAVRFSADGEHLLTVPLTNRFRVLHTRPLRDRLAAAAHSFGKR